MEAFSSVSGAFVGEHMAPGGVLTKAIKTNDGHPGLVVVVLAVAVVVVALVLLAYCVSSLEFPDVLDTTSEGRNLVRKSCGGRPVFTMFGYRDCLQFLAHRKAQERPVPALVFKNAFNTPHGTGICSSTGPKCQSLRRVLLTLLCSEQTVRAINWCSAQTLETLGTRASRDTRQLLQLKEAESWVTDIMVTVLFAETRSDLKKLSMPKLDAALDKLFKAREEIGQTVYSLNLLTWLSRPFHHLLLLKEYNRARNEVVSLLEVCSLEKFQKIAIISPGEQDFTDEDILETYIEALLYCKKKVGLALFTAMHKLARLPHWLVTIKQFIDSPFVNDGPFRLINDSTPVTRQMMTIVFEAIRLAEQSLCCHLRKTSDDCLLADAEQTTIPKGSVVHVASWSDKEYFKEPHHDGFFPSYWFREHDCQSTINPEVTDRVAPFGMGERACIGRRFSCNVVFCLLAHVVRAGNLLGATEDGVVFGPRPTFIQGENVEYFNEIGSFWFTAEIP